MCVCACVCVRVCVRERNLIFLSNLAFILISFLSSFLPLIQQSTQEEQELKDIEKDEVTNALTPTFPALLQNETEI